jgi:L-rhamnose mutarotase
MTVHAFRMQLLPGNVEEYKRRHDEIWPDLAAAITDAGIYDYSIFLDEQTLSIFAVLKLREDDHRDELRNLPVMQRWWEYMAPLMEVRPDNRPVEWPLQQVFHLA